MANDMISRKPAPEIRIGLVTYRDKGDEYVTKSFDLSDDIDSVYTNLRSFKADGGGDSPESVNQALDDAVNKIHWSQDKGVLRVIFLVGDYPPHMDYQDDVKYQATCQVAMKKDLIINTIQCGNVAETTPVWQEIARLSEGQYVQLSQTGDMVAIATPFDAEMAKANAELNKTVIAYGSAGQQAAVGGKVAMSSAVAASAPAAAADRATYNSKDSGKAIQGRGDLVNDLRDGSAKLEVLKAEELPEPMRKMDDKERKAYVEKHSAERDKLNKQVAELAKQREEYINAEKKKQAAAGGGKDSFDATVSRIIDAEAAKKMK
jgi:flavin-binding protein dodecin